MENLIDELGDEFDKAKKIFEESNKAVDYHRMNYRENRLYNCGVSLGKVLLPVYKKNKLIAEVGWVGNLGYSYEQNVIMYGSGLLKVGSNIVLTKINGHALSTAEIVSESKATELIMNSGNSYLLDILHL